MTLQISTHHVRVLVKPVTTLVRLTSCEWCACVDSDVYGLIPICRSLRRPTTVWPHVQEVDAPDSYPRTHATPQGENVGNIDAQFLTLLTSTADVETLLQIVQIGTGTQQSNHTVLIQFIGYVVISKNQVMISGITYTTVSKYGPFALQYIMLSYLL